MADINPKTKCVCGHEYCEHDPGDCSPPSCNHEGCDCKAFEECHEES